MYLSDGCSFTLFYLLTTLNTLSFLRGRHVKRTAQFIPALAVELHLPLELHQVHYQFHSQWLTQGLCLAQHNPLKYNILSSQIKNCKEETFCFRNSEAEVPLFCRRHTWHYGVNSVVTGPSTASFPFGSRGIIATQWTALLQRDWGLHAGGFLHQQHPDNARPEHHIRQQAEGNGMWGLQGACLLGKEHNHKLLVESAEPCPGWQACCRGQPERAIILWGGGNYSELLMVFFLAVLRNGAVSQAWPWKGLHMAKRLCWSISHVSATHSAWNFPLFFSIPTLYFRSLLWGPFLPQFA